MFKGWNLLRTSWGPQRDRWERPLLDCMDVGQLVILSYIQFTFPYAWKVIRANQALTEKEEEVTVGVSTYHLLYCCFRWHLASSLYPLCLRAHNSQWCKGQHQASVIENRQEPLALWQYSS